MNVNKLQLSIVAILIALARVFVVEAQAHTSDCPPLQACPPVLACQEGYSCQPDELLSPPPGETQKYPSADGEAWVNSIVSTSTLTDVAINDSRWEEREEGEVYARENRDFIVWYWPNGGNAVFDTTSLGSQHTWYDFTFNTGVADSGGPMESDINMPIKFSNGQGISIFKRTEETELPTPTDGGGFLTLYTNPERERLPANRIYPVGQRMMLTAWNPTKLSQVEDLHRHGFTAVGPWENAWSTGFDLQAVINRAKENGMRAWMYMHNKYQMVYELCNAWASGKTMEETIRPAVNLWDQRYSKNPYNDVADAYVLLPEELSSRLDKCSEAKLLAYNNKMIKKIEELTGGDRPIIRTEVSGNSSINIQKTSRHNDVAVQHYFENYGAPGRPKYAAYIQVRNRGYLKYHADLENNYPLDRPRVTAILPGMIYEPVNGSKEATKQYADYYIWTSLIQGFKSFSLYKLDRNVAGGNLKEAYKDTIKQMTDFGFDQAFLWGNSNPGLPLTITRTAGPADANWSKGLRSYKAESMLAAERQFGDKRYIAITNSHWSQDIKVKISGLPVGNFNFRNCKAGKVEKITSSSKTVTIGPNGYAIYRIEKKP